MALVRVAALRDFRTNPLSTTDVSTGYQLGAPLAGQKLFAGMHLTSASLGTTARMLVMTIQTATASGFGAPSTPISFVLSTVFGAEWGAPSTFSTDQSWMRASWTLSTGVSTGG